MSDHPHVKILSRTVEFEGWHKLESFEIEMKSLKSEAWVAPMKREVFFSGEAAVILLYLPETDQVLLNEQFRLVPYLFGDENPWMIECCAGGVDEGETPEAAARREAVEETGCEVLDLETIGSVYPSCGGVYEKYHLFCGRIAKADHGGFFGIEHEGEEIKTHLVDAAAAIEMLDSGKIVNGGAVMCLHWFARHHDRLRQKWGPK